jgi:hypothetical protein
MEADRHKAGGMDDSTVGNAGKRFEKALKENRQLRQVTEQAERKLRG